jgi:hypothetical protein
MPARTRQSLRQSRCLSKRDYGDNSPSQKRPFVAKGVWVRIRRLKNHPALMATNPTQRRTHVCTRLDCWCLINMGYDKGQKCWQTTKGIPHDKRYHADESKSACALARRREVQERLKVNVMLSSYAGPAQIVVCKRDAALAGLARCYTYGRGRISKETFNDQAHRDRDQRMFETGGGKGKAPFLTKKNLVEWVRANSAANLILTKGNTLLAEGEINMCTVLRMNRSFMEFMRNTSTTQTPQSNGSR